MEKKFRRLLCRSSTFSSCNFVPSFLPRLPPSLPLSLSLSVPLESGTAKRRDHSERERKRRGDGIIDDFFVLKAAIHVRERSPGILEKSFPLGTPAALQHDRAVQITFFSVKPKPRA